jgi:hypothetical protein
VTPTLAAGAAADLHADVTWREVEVVVHHDQVFVSVARKRRARVVHERRWFQEGDFFGSEAHRGGLGLLPFSPGAAVTAG